jgi:hypothetical protein
LVGESERKRPLEMPGSRWNDNNKMDLRQTGLQGADLIRLDQDRDRWQVVVSTAMNFLVP